MALIYMHFDFGADEEKAQQARHKLDVWKQAFRLDKKLQYKLDRPEDDEAEAEESAAEEGPLARGQFVVGGREERGAQEVERLHRFRHAGPSYPFEEEWKVTAPLLHGAPLHC